MEKDRGKIKAFLFGFLLATVLASFIFSYFLNERRYKYEQVIRQYETGWKKR